MSERWRTTRIILRRLSTAVVLGFVYYYYFLFIYFFFLLRVYKNEGFGYTNVQFTPKRNKGSGIQVGIH